MSSGFVMYDRAEHALKEAEKLFRKMDDQQRLDFIDNIETGTGHVDPRLAAIASTMRAMLDARVDSVRELGTGKLQDLIENYFPHIWKDSSAAEKWIARFFSKRPLEGSKSFLKKRTIPTTRDGIEQGG